MPQIAPFITETSETLTIEGQGYRLVVRRAEPVVELSLHGRAIADLQMASALDTLTGLDEQSWLGAPTFYREPEGIGIVWQGSSQLWASKRVELRAWAGGFSYGYAVEGHGRIDQAHFWRSASHSSPAHAVRLFNPEPNSGNVQYSNQRCEAGKHCELCYPPDGISQWPADYMTISVGKDRHYHDGNWMFTPGPFCYAVEGDGNWLGLGVAALPGQWNFAEMSYGGPGFGFSLAYEGHTEVNGHWQSPILVCQTAPDEYAALETYCNALRQQGLTPDQGRGPQQEWWKEPIFCGWGEQVSQELHEAGGPKAADRATQANYTAWLARLDAQAIAPGTVVLDDKWQQSYGLNVPDADKWPDLPGFIVAQHARGRRVLLWLKAWDCEGLPAAECILDEQGQPLVADPGQPAYRERLYAQVRRLLAEYGADGFKIDFTHLTPRGRPSVTPQGQPSRVSAGGRWGLELLRQWLEIVSQAAREVKPDALLMAHTANPYLADLVDMLRLNDIAGTEDKAASLVPAMRHRQSIARLASPYWLLDADNWPCSSRIQWRDYVQAQSSGEFGVPSLYFAERLAWAGNDVALDAADYATIRASWATYRAGLTAKPAAKALSLRQKVGQLIMVEIPGTRLTEETARFIRECHPAGVALFGHNLAGPWATRRLISDLQTVAAESGDSSLLVGIDQEGGQVAHLRYPCVEMPSQMARMAAGGPAACREAAEVLGREMARLGINLAFSPVVDINTNPANPVIGTRAFSDDPQTVAECAVATIEGLRRTGVLTMAKHFPGHGDTSHDSHLGQPVVPHQWARLQAVELTPFRAAITAQVDSLCSAHIVYPGVDESGLPATLSRRMMTGLLRDELGFEGVLFSDALTMDAIAKKDSANIPAAAIAAVQAGVDCLMVLGSLVTQRRCYDALLEAVESGVIPIERLDQAVARVQALRHRVQPAITDQLWPDPDHQAIARRLAQAAVTVARDEAGLLPLGWDGAGVGVIELAAGSISPVEASRNEPLNQSTLALLLGREWPQARFLALPPALSPASLDLAAFLTGCDRLIIATRSAVLDPAQIALLRQIVAACPGKTLLQLALRNPYDAEIAPAIGTVLLTYGDQPSAISAVVDVLTGRIIPAGQLPVRFKTSVAASAGRLT